jgi:peptide/nickel transport system substrate-binding protein
VQSQSTRVGTRALYVMCALLVGSVGMIGPGATIAAPRYPSRAAATGTLIFATDQLPADIDPASNALAASDVVARNTAQTLVGLDGASVSRYTPVLATSWSANADKSVWTFHLRHGVKFHTGRCCMTATDVQYSLARTMTLGLTNAYLLGRFISKPMAQIKVVDPYTVEFDLGRPQPIFVSALAQNYVTLILDSQALKAHEKNHDWGHAWATDHDAGTGPYMLAGSLHADQVMLKSFAGYWGGWSGAHLNTILITNVPDSATRRELIEKGKADLTLDLTIQDYQALEKNPQIQVFPGIGVEVQFISMNEVGALASPYARQALSYAFNYDAYVNGVNHGFARRAYGPYASTLLGYDPNIFKYQTDLAKARQLLQKAGIKAGTTLTYAYTDPFGTEGKILQAQLQQIGINLQIQQLSVSAYNALGYGTEPASKRPNLWPSSWWPDYNDPYDQALPLLASNSAPPNGANFGFYKNLQVDSLLNQMKSADSKTLKQLARKLQDQTGRVDPPAIWTSEPAEPTVLSSAIKGFIFNPLYPRTFDFYALHR